MNDHSFYMKQALLEARKAYERGEIPIGAVVSTLGGKYLNECTLYVTVEPCVMCAGAIGWAQLKCLVYGAEDEKRGYLRYAPQALHPKTEVISGVLADECAALMKDFFAAKRR